ncbi:hypothetical protein T06_7659 [Trichinella sp. T6]|nr:hypothetical protein T06_7659 [Trichinella sp. T6]
MSFSGKTDNGVGRLGVIVFNVLFWLEQKLMKWQMTGEASLAMSLTLGLVVLLDHLFLFLCIASPSKVDLHRVTLRKVKQHSFI